MIDRLARGWGINDAPYKVLITEKVCGKLKTVWKCPYYIKWYSMLDRCFGKKYQEGKPTYTDKFICEDWKYFMNFKDWMLQQQYLDFDGSFLHLDKDLLVMNNHIYSPETCVFLPNDVNGFLTKRQNDRGELPIGVSINRVRDDGVVMYKASISNIKDTNKRGSSEHFSSVSSILLAHKNWQIAKIKSAKYYQDKYANYKKLCNGLQRVIDKIQYDLDNNLITEDF